MTGILITAGDKPFPEHDRGCAFFTECKGMQELHRETGECLCISAFAGKGMDDDSPAAPGVAPVFVLGMLVYRGRHGRDALNLFREDLRTRAIEDIACGCDGQFCMVMGDPSGRSFRIITDHTGIINMYIYRSGKAFSISSSSMALSRAYPVTTNPPAIAQFLRAGSVYGSGTIYQEISLLEPASVYSFEMKDGEVSAHRETYWKPPTEVQEGMSFYEARDSLMQNMLESFQALPREGVLCDLTAGFDSRLILSLMSALRPLRDMEIFVFGPPGSREVHLVGGYCRELGMLKNHLALPHDWDQRIGEYVRKALYVTDGEENVFVYAPILLAQEHKALTHAYSVNGLGGELYRDFWWIQELYPSKRPANLNRLISTRILQYEYDQGIFSDAWAQRMSGIQGIFRREFQGSIHDMDPCLTYNTLQIDNLYFRQKLHRWAGRTISSSGQIVRMLTPLTMKECITTALSIPPRYKRNGRLVKSIIEELSPALSGLKMLNGAPCRNMTLGNAHEFMPLALDYGRRGMTKLAQKFLKKTVMLDRSLNYQQSDFFAALFSQNGFREDFEYDALMTGRLYRPDAYARFYNDAAQGRSRYYHQLGNLLTLEMRMRGDNIQKESESF